MNIMLRWTRRIAIFLLLGAAINCAVAWGCTVIAKRVTKCYATYVNPREGEALLFELHKAFGYRLVCGLPRWWEFYTDETTARATGPTYGSIVWWPRYGLEDPFTSQVAAGWPFLSVRATLYPDWIEPLKPVDDLLSGKTTAGQPDSATDWAADARRRTLLSLRPIPIGFAINTTILATLLLCLIAGRDAIRRRTRNHFGCCVSCGYPRSTSPVCTECGQPLPTQAAK